MSGSSKYDELMRSYRELETATRLWMAANQAKDERIAELEAECARLQQRVARLGRLAARGEKLSRQEKVRHVR